MKPRLLDLFCGAGGCTKGYQRAGFYVVGVDINPQPNYCGDEFIQMDAITYMDAYSRYGEGLRGEVFDAIHASPPCQAYSAATGDANRDNHPRLIEPTRDLLRATELPYVIENVERAPLIDPVSICGTMFDPILGVKRHRLFETNWPLDPPMWPCRHMLAGKRFRIYEHGKWRMTGFAPVFGTGGRKAREHWADAMGIDWMTHDEMAEAVPPAYTEFIGRRLMAHLRGAQPSGRAPQQHPQPNTQEAA